jgi:putative redox protein
MKIQIKRLNDAVHLEAINEEGAKIEMDGSPAIGGQNLGMRPMQVLLASLGGCSSMDVLSILKKMQQNVSEYYVELNGEREQGVEPSLFKDIDVKFKLKGDNLDAGKVQRAIELSMNKYCSVAKTLEPTAKITYSFEIL